MKALGTDFPGCVFLALGDVKNLGNKRPGSEGFCCVCVENANEQLREEQKNLGLISQVRKQAVFCAVLNQIYLVSIF